MARRQDGRPEQARAAKDLVDKLAEHDEPVTIFCVHDADAAGTLIYQTFQEATKARREARKIKIVDLGLQPWEAIAMGLEVSFLSSSIRIISLRDSSPVVYWQPLARTRSTKRSRSECASALFIQCATG